MECPICKKDYDEEFYYCPWCGSENPKNSLEIIEEDTLIEEEFKNIEEELKALEEDAIRFEKERAKEEELETPNSDFNCTHCGSGKFIYDYERGEVVCARCGLVVYDRLLDVGAPWLYTHEKTSREHLKFY